MKDNRSQLDTIIQGLKESPLFQLSLSSKELFHSNFLAWLFERYPQIPSRIFLNRVSTCDNVKVLRESHNIDLILKFPATDDLVIIENKVKCLATREQLIRYADEQLNRYNKQHDKSKIHFVLLSLTKPEFVTDQEKVICLDGEVNWTYFSYGELARRLSEIQPELLAKTSYHSSLMCDYISFIQNLDNLQRYFQIDWEQHSDDLFLSSQETVSLKEIRIHDLIEKLRYCQFAQQVKKVLVSKNFKLVPEILLNGQPGEVLVDFGMTRGMGLFDLKYCITRHETNPVILGVQIQNNQFRLVVEVKHDKLARKIAAKLWQSANTNKLWFDFCYYSTDSEEYPKKDDFNTFGNVFFYRAMKLKHFSPQKLLDIIVKYAEFARENQNPIKEQINLIE
jgi:hypothetical protein